MDGCGPASVVSVAALACPLVIPAQDTTLVRSSQQSGQVVGVGIVRRDMVLGF
jgi:hypothetical protein